MEILNKLAKQADYGWNQVVQQPLWQLLVVLLTVLSTTFFTYFFSGRSKRTIGFVKSKARIRTNGHVLSQVIRNQADSIKSANYYEGKMKFVMSDTDKIFYQTLATDTVRPIADQNRLVSECYGRLMGELDGMRDYISKKDYEEIMKLSDKIYNHGSIVISAPDPETNQEQLLEYLKDVNKSIVKYIKDEVDEPLEALIKKLDEVSVVWWRI